MMRLFLTMVMLATSSLSSLAATTFPAVLGGGLGTVGTLPFVTYSGATGSVRFAATRLALMDSTWSPSASQLHEVSRIFFATPAYKVQRLRFHFSNWQVNIGGTTPAEIANTNAQVIEGAYLECGGLFQEIKFGGNSGITLASGGESSGGGVWSDPTPVQVAVNQNCFVRTASSVASGATRIGGYSPGSYTPNGLMGEGVMYSGSTLSAFLTQGQIVGVSPHNTVAFGPDSMVAEGNDGRPVVLIVGDSISIGVGSAIFDARGNIGYMERGLDEAALSTRMPYGNFGVSGALYITESPMSSNWTNRLAMLASLPNVPFTTVWSELGINDIRNNTEAWPTPLQTNMQAWWTDINTNFSGVPLVQSTVGPCTTGTFGTLPGQSVAAQCATPSGQLFSADNYIATTPSPYLSGYVDIMSSFADAVEIDHWSVTGVVNTTLAFPWQQIEAVPGLYISANVPVGAPLFVTTESRVPSILSIDPIIGAYASVLNTGPQAVRASGSAVVAPLTGDGLHPTYTIVGRAVTVVAVAKNANVFH